LDRPAIWCGIVGTQDLVPPDDEIEAFRQNFCPEFAEQSYDLAPVIDRPGVLELI
jgi:hypothetical protein